MRTIALSLMLCGCASAALAGDTVDNQLPWTGEGTYRVVVEVQPVDIGKRTSDEMPAAAQMDIRKLSDQLGGAVRIDTSSIHVVPVGALQSSGEKAREAPYRWYDSSMPYDFPDVDDAMDRMEGKLVRKIKPRFGYATNSADEGFGGQLAWSHMQTGHATSSYCIYFNTLSEGENQTSSPRRGWIGDGGIRRAEKSKSTTGCEFTRVALADWNGDGLIDIVFGEYTGQLYWFPNLGTKERPDYRYFKMIFDVEGYPVDVGQYSTPSVQDWDGDGAQDVLLGCANNRIAWYKNVGTNAERKLKYMGQVEADGKPLEMPKTPLGWGSPEIFTREDAPVPQIVDWDADGLPDLLTGGWITGRIFFFKNMGRDAATGIPKLHLVGPIECDGKPLNVKYWAASPCAADFDGDGDLDVISGSDFRYRPDEAPAGESAQTLRYYENVGASTSPRLTEKKFPRTNDGPFDDDLAKADAFDMNGDGLLDLVVSRRQNISVYYNRGTAREPRWDCTSPPIRTAWGVVPVEGFPFVDFNHDGQMDFEDGFDVMLKTDGKTPGEYGPAESVLQKGDRISHRSNTGDGWFWPRLYDFDRDGRPDILFGDWWGRVWYHRNIGDGRFDTAGFAFKTQSGTEVRVGPIDRDTNKDFTALQGARTTFVGADFNGDGKTDLVIADTYGLVRYFQNAGTVEQPVFADPIVIGDLQTRSFVDAIDWDDDGAPDVVASAADGVVRVYQNRLAEKPPHFLKGIDPGLPPSDSPRVATADLNGDGDVDFYVRSIQGSGFVERSFLRNGGYVQAKLLRVEKKPEKGGK